MQIKINKNGKITIPKYFRDKYNLNYGISITISNTENGILLTPVAVCSACGKALSQELYVRGACKDCTPAEREITQIY